MKPSFPLYLIADPSFYGNIEIGSSRGPFFRSIQEAIEGGIRLIQYRDKGRPRAEMYEIAKRLREITRTQDVTLIINDEVDLAMAVEADGVHLGQDDFPVQMARKLLGKNATIGLSTHNLEQAIDAEREALDYIGFGPIFETKTKPSKRIPLGIDTIASLRANVSLPIYAIGGIQRSHITKILSAGASGIAVSSALIGVDKKTIRNWLNLLTSSNLGGGSPSPPNGTEVPAK